VIYTTHGDSSLPKEHAEFFADGMAGTITDFKKLELVKDGKSNKVNKRMVTEKGHRNELERFFGIVGQNKSVDFESNIVTTLATFKVVESIKKIMSVKLKV
jgi:hypothetical protein